ncbi:MAG: hypothetical protein AB7Q23_12465 [Hyphomonadaceae bacterium]
MQTRRWIAGVMFSAPFLIDSASAQCRPANRRLTVSEANAALLAEARRDLNRDVGQDCKNWMRMVVGRAVPGCVVPSTYPNADGYMWAESPGWVGQSMPIENVRPGHIIQMRLFTRSGPIPHTSLVSARSSRNVTLIHSNFRIRNTVTEDVFTFADFSARVRDPSGTMRYSVYAMSF